MELDCANSGQSPAIVYQVLSGKLLGELHTQVLVLGIFAVFLGFLREFMESGPREGPIIKRGLLFMGVLLFASYVAYTYTLEGQANYPYDEIGQWWKCAAGKTSAQAPFGDNYRDIARILLLALTPIDLLVVGLIAFLFVIIAQVRIGRSVSESSGLIVERAIATTEKFSLGRHLPLLYIATGLAHAMFCLWWFVRGLLTESPIDWQDVEYHATYTAAYAAGAIANYIVYRIYRPERTPDFFQWIGVFGYLGLTGSAYVFRTYAYFDKALMSG